MEFYETAEGRLGLRDIPEFLANLLRQIPGSSEGDFPEVEERFFPDPSDEPDEDELRQDWKAHVEPELHGIFQSARLVVEADLRGMREADDEFTLEFSRGHADAWVSALNQARLALAAQHHFGEDELAATELMPIQSARDLTLLQINFYGYVEQWLVEVLDA